MASLTESHIGDEWNESLHVAAVLRTVKNTWPTVLCVGPARCDKLLCRISPAAAYAGGERYEKENKDGKKKPIVDAIGFFVFMPKMLCSGGRIV